jgi:hypothetical protein
MALVLALVLALLLSLEDGGNAVVAVDTLAWRRIVSYFVNHYRKPFQTR